MGVGDGDQRKSRQPDQRPLRPGSLAVARTDLRGAAGGLVVTRVVLEVVALVVLVVWLDVGAAGELRAESDSGPDGAGVVKG